MTKWARAQSSRTAKMMRARECDDKCNEDVKERVAVVKFRVFYYFDALSPPHSQMHKMASSSFRSQPLFK